MENGAIDDLLLRSMADRLSRKRTRRTGMKRAFAIGFAIIAVIMIFGSFRAHAMSLSAPIPNGVGFTLKFPLHGDKMETNAAEFHMAALHNGSEMMRADFPVHGRFVRFRVAGMKYVMRFAGPEPGTRIAAPPASQDRSPENRPGPLYRKAAFTVSDIAPGSLAGAPPAHYRHRVRVTAGGALPPGRGPVESRGTGTAGAPVPVSGYREYAKRLAIKYGKMRHEYMRSRARSPKAASRAYRKLMKFHALARKWQRYAG